QDVRAPPVRPSAMTRRHARMGRARLLTAARMSRVERLAHPGWCRNLVGAARLEPGEHVLIVVDEPLVEEGSQLLAAGEDAGAEPRLELWTGKRPLARARAGRRRRARRLAPPLLEP